MAKSPTKTATTTTAQASENGMATINFDKAAHGGVVRGAVNGQAFEFPVDSDVQVNKEQLEALNNSGATFKTVTPLAGEGAAEGSAASSTVSANPIPLDPVVPKTDADGNPLPVPELRQITDKELTGGADQQASKDSAEA